MSIYREAKLMVGDRIIRRVGYYTDQREEARKDSKGNMSYNEKGAVAYLKAQRADWEASDQFIGQNLRIEVER